jgi:DNA-binding transcriptional LysR family regulator
MIDKLEFLLALARERHFGRAAEACGVTQPTMSAAIKQLEESLGVLLVQRGSRFIGLTPEGEHVLEWAKRIVSDTRAMRQEISSLKRGLSGHLRIAAIPTALGMVAALTAPFCARHPDVKFTVLSRRSHEVLTLLDELEIHAGITYLDNEPLGHVNTVPHPRHAEPPHHRQASWTCRHQSCFDARIGLHGGALCACKNGSVGEHYAG